MISYHLYGDVSIINKDNIKYTELIKKYHTHQLKSLTKKVVKTVRENKAKNSALEMDLLEPLFLYKIEITKVEKVEAEEITKSIETK